MTRPTNFMMKALLSLFAAALLSCAANGSPTEPSGAGAGAEPETVESVAAALEPGEFETAITPVADTFIRKYDDDTNYGTNAELRSEGTLLTSHQHTLIRFDSAAIATAVAGDNLLKAELELTINHISGFWGDGAVSIHRMTMPWTETGATWNCANDTATWNFWTDCTSANRWGLDWFDPFPQPFVAQPTDIVDVGPLQTGTIRFDVTADVAQFLANPNSNRGWMVRATHEPFIVRVHYRARQTASPPRLIVKHGVDSCPDDPAKMDPGVCGCGEPEVNTDGDTAPNCIDECPLDPRRVVRGQCGCVGEDFALPAGTACSDGFCANANKCDGAGSCGSPTLNECIPSGQPPRGCQVRVHDDHAYLFCTSDVTFTVARDYCTAASMKLVRIDDAAEDAFVGSNLSEPSWIGASDTVEGQWRWLDGNTQFWQGAANGTAPVGTYENWEPSEPNASSSSDDCAIYDRSSAGAPLGWDDRVCTTTRGFVCEITDQCPADPTKEKPGFCECGVPEDVVTIGNQQVVVCSDQCPDDATKVAPGVCGCGIPEGLCPLECPNNLSDPSSPVYGKLQAGSCGCNTPDVDANNNGVLDCFESVGQCGTPGSPAPAGTPCDDSICAQRCPVTTVCNGSGVCGNPSECAPTGAGTCSYKVFRDHVYWFCTGERTRAEAQTICGQDGMGSLVSIDDEAENEFVLDNIADDSWTSGNQAAPGAWTWANATCDDAKPFWDGGASGEPHRDAAYANWTNGAPASGTYAVVLDGADPNAGQWQAQSGGVNAFVCEKPKPLAPFCSEQPECLAEYFGVGDCDGPLHEACVPESEALPELAGLSEEQAQAAMEACDAACQPSSTQADCEAACAAQGIEPPPVGSGCVDIDSPEISEACKIADDANGDPEWYADPATGDAIACRNTLQCAQRGDLPADVVCGFMRVCTDDPGATDVPQCPAAVPGGPDVPLEQGGKTGTVRVCGKPDEHCLTGQGGDPVRCDSTPLLCEPADARQVVDTLVFPEGPPEPTCPSELFEDPPLPEPDLTVPYSSWEQPCGPGGCTGANSGQNHPYCKYRASPDGELQNAIDPDRNHARAKNENSSGSSKIIDFEFDPRLDLDYRAKLGPLGVPDVSATAGAGLVAKAVFNPGKLPFGGDVELMNLTARAHADRCQVTTEGSHVRLFGHDFLPSEAQLDLEIPGCEEALNTFENYANRASKSMRDVLTLLKQYERAKQNGGRLDLSALCAAGSLFDDPPADFPLPLNCGDQPAEAHINELINYYEDKVLELVQSGTALAEEALTLEDTVPVFKTTVGDEEITLFSVSFLIGPIPVTLEAFVAAHYGVGLDVGYRLSPGKAVSALILPNAETAKDYELIAVFVNGGPNAQAMLGFFAGVGFSYGPVAASIGIEARLSLGVISLNVNGGAGLLLSGAPDPRPLGPDFESLALPGAEPMIQPMVYKIKLGYSAGLSADIRNILSGDVNAKLKLKFFWFSKTFRKRLLRFDGLCTDPSDLKDFPCHIPILELDGGTTLADFPWATVRMNQILPKLKYLPPPSEPDPMTTPAPTPVPVDMTHLEELFYDRLCGCVASGDVCQSNGDCCDGLQCADDGTGVRTCGCRATGDSCSTDGDCCGGQPCVSGVCQCSEPQESCSDNGDCCGGQACVSVPGGGRCECSDLNDVCDADSDCCSNYCFDGTCSIWLG